MPKLVLECYEKYPNYFRAHESVYINGLHIGYYSGFPVDTSVIIKDQKVGDKILALDSQIETMSNKIKKSKRELEEIIFRFSTFEKLRREFPEAAKFLPKTSEITSVSIKLPELLKNIDDI